MIPLGDPRIDRPLTELLAICTTLTDWNDPRTTGTGIVSPNKPESRPPGETQADWGIRRAEATLLAAVKTLRDIQRDVTPKERSARPVKVESVGGIPTDIIEDAPALSTYKRKTSITVRERRLVAKMQEVAIGE